MLRIYKFDLREISLSIFKLRSEVGPLRLYLSTLSVKIVEIPPKIFFILHRKSSSHPSPTIEEKFDRRNYIFIYDPTFHHSL